MKRREAPKVGIAPKLCRHKGCLWVASTASRRFPRGCRDRPSHLLLAAAAAILATDGREIRPRPSSRSNLMVDLDFTLIYSRKEVTSMHRPGLILRIIEVPLSHTPTPIVVFIPA